jgi:glyoxylase-like metal-dependent hydrolase (beta-lactamase superfamily II)
MTGWTEIADGILRRRYQPYDVGIAVVRGSAGLLVVDTRASHVQARELLDDLAQLGDVPVRWVVDSHAHFDHTFGNAVLAKTGARLVGHVRIPAHFDAYERPMIEEQRRAGGDPEVAEVELTEPDELVDDGARIDLGDREVVLRHLGRGHTDNDLLVHVRDAQTWLVGDLLEESGPPMYGTGSYPLEWPGTITALLRELEPGALVVPAHGTPVDAAFAAAQQADLATVADLVVELHAAGVPEAAAVDAAAGRWPFPDRHVADAVRDGYRSLA